MLDKPRLYVDVDDTLISECFVGSGFDLRPGVVTQLSVLGKLFECYWLTHRTEEDLVKTFDGLYAQMMMKKFQYAEWRAVDETDKAPFVLTAGQNHDFYWVEDPLSTGDLTQLHDAGLTERYVPVDPKGLWGFTRALRVLFDRAGIKEADIKKAGGKAAWFNEPLGLHFDWTYYE